MGDEERFKTTKFGGYDKEEVLAELQKMKENAHAEKAQILRELENTKRAAAGIQKEITVRDAKIAELQETIASKEREIADLNRTIREKYQSYVDNYDTIGSLIYESKIRAKQIIRETEEEQKRILEEAQEEAQRIREEAESAAQRRLDDVQIEIDDRNTAGRMQLESVQEELNSALDIFNKLQRQFMSSYKSIQQIVRDRPEGPDTDEDVPTPQQEDGSQE